MTDYTQLDGPDMLKELGMDAAKWAEAFCQCAKKQGIEIDEGWMICWFANAIMNTHDILTGNGPVKLPDGSGFAIGSF